MVSSKMSSVLRCFSVSAVRGIVPAWCISGGLADLLLEQVPVSPDSWVCSHSIPQLLAQRSIWEAQWVAGTSGTPNRQSPYF